MTSGTEPVRAAIYCRMSLALLGDTTKIEDQERICRELATQRGWELAEGVGHPDLNGVFTDNNKSAWQKRVKRYGWKAMLEAVDAGKVNAIIAYHGDRLVRQPMDLEKLIELAEGKGIKLASPTGDWNISVSQDRIMLRVIAAFAEGESARTSERRKSQYDRWRLQGKVRGGGRGGRAYGFKSDGVTQVPAEVGVIQEIAERILYGESILSICRVLNDRKLRTTAGSQWTHATVKKMMRRPRYAGLMPDGENPGAWEPVLDRDMWEAVKAALETKARGFTYTARARKHLLSGLAACGACHKALQIRADNRPGYGPSYGCVNPECRKVMRSVKLLDAYVVRRVVNRLSLEANPPGQIPDAPGLAAQFAALSTLRAETEAAIRDPGQALAPMLARLENVDQRLTELRELAAGDARHRLLSAHTGLTEAEFGGLPLAVRRALVAACYTVTVLPASGRGPGFRTEDVCLAPR